MKTYKIEQSDSSGRTIYDDIYTTYEEAAEVVAWYVAQDEEDGATDRPAYYIIEEDGENQRVQLEYMSHARR